MAAPSTPAVEPQTWIVSEVTKSAMGLYVATVVAPDGTAQRVVMSAGVVSLANVVVSAQVVAMLWNARRGATPLAVG